MYLLVPIFLSSPLLKLIPTNPAALSLPPSLSLRPSPGRGLGMFALSPVPAFEEVGRYAGELICAAENERRYKGGGWRSRLWRLGRRLRGETVTGDYVYSIEPDLLVDGEDTARSGWTRYLNHSGEPNLAAKSLAQDMYGGPKVWFYALRDIDVGEELTFSYGSKYWDENDDVL
jgi:SET domain-containing protein